MRCAGAGCSLACRGPDLGNVNEKPTQQMTDPQTQPTIHACLLGSASARYVVPTPLRLPPPQQPRAFLQSAAKLDGVNAFFCGRTGLRRTRRTIRSVVEANAGRRPVGCSCTHKILFRSTRVREFQRAMLAKTQLPTSLSPSLVRRCSQTRSKSAGPS